MLITAGQTGENLVSPLERGVPFTAHPGHPHSQCPGPHGGQPRCWGRSGKAQGRRHRLEGTGPGQCQGKLGSTFPGQRVLSCLRRACSLGILRGPSFNGQKAERRPDRNAARISLCLSPSGLLPGLKGVCGTSQVPTRPPTRCPLLPISLCPRWQGNLCRSAPWTHPATDRTRKPYKRQGPGSTGGKLCLPPTHHHSRLSASKNV